MNLSRRRLLAHAASLAAAGGIVGVSAMRTEGGEAVAEVSPETSYIMRPIGRVEKTKSGPTRIVLFDRYRAGLKGLEEWSHVNVFWWFHKNDVPRKRSILQVHPRGNKRNPLTGVFATRSPVRPNLLALTMCKIVSVEGDGVTVEKIDAFNGTPVLDLKPLIPPDVVRGGIQVPGWARGGPKKRD